MDAISGGGSKPLYINEIAKVVAKGDFPIHQLERFIN